MKSLIKRLAPLWDIILSPLVLFSLLLLKQMRRVAMSKTPLTRFLYEKVGLFPILDHWGEPSFKRTDINLAKRTARILPGLDLNQDGQLALLDLFDFNDELKSIPLTLPKKDYGKHYFYNNQNFESGDAEFYYNIIRHFKPSRIVEIGCGHSTLLARLAIEKNNKPCRHIAIEPYQNPWLKDLTIELINKKVEDVEIDFFRELTANDILFIDSSHLIRPQGDVLQEFLTILPSLDKGVIIHIHDIFTPNDYPKDWLIDELKFFNEQYLLEAFLSHNQEFEVIGALNFLRHHQPEKLAAKCPVLASQLEQREPGSFWIRKIR